LSWSELALVIDTAVFFSMRIEINNAVATENHTGTSVSRAVCLDYAEPEKASIESSSRLMKNDL
jgi:hypothetical protein